MRVIKLNKAEEKGTFLSDRVVPGNLLFHVLLQESHVAKEATSESSHQLEQQLDLWIVTSVEKTLRQ